MNVQTIGIKAALVSTKATTQSILAGASYSSGSSNVWLGYTAQTLAGSLVLEGIQRDASTWSRIINPETGVSYDTGTVEVPNMHPMTHGSARWRNTTGGALDLAVYYLTVS